MDYRALLKKYMMHIIEEESVDYLAVIGEHTKTQFSDDDLRTLQDISDEILEERTKAMEES